MSVAKQQRLVLTYFRLTKTRVMFLSLRFLCIVLLICKLFTNCSWNRQYRYFFFSFEFSPMYMQSVNNGSQIRCELMLKTSILFMILFNFPKLQDKVKLHKKIKKCTILYESITVKIFFKRKQRVFIP